MVKAVLLTVILGYLLGNINGSVIISRLAAGDDVRRHGSGNAGFTNFFRNYGRSNSLFVMAIDIAKALAACYLGMVLFAPLGIARTGAALGGAAVSVGHDFPALLGFKGGKGIVCGLAAAAMVDWRLGAVCLVAFAIAYLPKRLVSLGSIFAAVSFGVVSVILYHRDLPVCILCLFMALLAVFMHRSNIVRLTKGAEKPTDFFGKGGGK